MYGNDKTKDFPEPTSQEDYKLFDLIQNAVKEQEDVQRAARECKKLFKLGASPEILATLEDTLRKRQNEKALIKHTDPSKQKNAPKSEDELKESLGEKKEGYNFYIESFLPALEKEIKNSKKLNREKKEAIVEIISEITSKSVNSQTSSDSVETPEFSIGSNSDSGISSPGMNEDSSKSSVSSRRSSVSSILSSAGEDSNLQKEETGNKVLLEQTAEEEPAQVSSQCLTLGSRKKENMDPDGQATQMTGSQPLQPEEKKNTAPIVQKPSANKNNSKGTPPEKQPNNRNLHVALVAGCALSTIGCIVAGAMTSGLVGAGLLAMAAVFAIAAVAELHSNFLSSKLTSINVSPLVNDKELTACSQR